MKSAVASAVLGAALFSQASLAATIGHSHGHLHRREAAAEPEKRAAVSFMATADVTSLEGQGIMIGKNLANGAKAPITVGGKGGPYVVEFNNKATEDIVVVVWSANPSNPYLSSFVKAQQADVTHTLKANTTTWVSFEPKYGTNNAISGAWGAIYPGDKTTWVGQVDNTWGEFTFTGDSQFSTTDVSRLINMKGRPMEIHNYDNKDDADNEATKPACSSTMKTCSFVCPDGQNTCLVGKIQNCEAGTPNTSADASGMDGGCTGMATTGYMQVNFS